MIGLEFIVEKAGSKYKEVAEYLNVSPKMVNDWVKNRSNIPKPRLKQLADFFGLEEDLFQKQLTRVEELEIEIFLFLKDNHQFENPEGGDYQENEKHLDLLTRSLEIEKRQEIILKKLQESVSNLVERKWSAAVKGESKEYEDRLEILIKSVDRLLDIFKVHDADFKSSEEKNQNKLIEAKKALMVRDMLYFVNKFFGVDEENWDDISPYITDTSAGRFDLELAKLQRDYYPIK